MIRRCRIRRERERPEDFVDSQRNRDQAIGNKPRNHPVTVCIATLCRAPEYSVIVGASDRMLTSDLIEFEPRLSKVHHITSNIVALIAGDTDAQAAVCVRVWDAKPKTVCAAAEVFSAELAAQFGSRPSERFSLHSALRCVHFLTNKRNCRRNLWTTLCVRSGAKELTSAR